MKIETVELEGKTYAEVDGGKIVLDDEGRKFAFDVLATEKVITGLRAENKAFRSKKNDLKEEIGAIKQRYAGLEDPDAAKAALDKIKALTPDGTINLEQYEAAVAKRVAEGLNSEIDSLKASLEETTGKLYNATVSNQFVTSETIKKTIFPASKAQRIYGSQFDADGTARGWDGDKIYSKEDPGKPAGFDEAMTVLIETDPETKADDVWRGSGASGSGSEHGSHGAGGHEAPTAAQQISDGLKSL